MDSLERVGFLAHAQTASFERVVEQAENIIRRWLDSCERPYVSFSGGKDSTALLSLVRSIAPETPALFGDDEWNLPETEELVAWTPNVIHVRSREQHTVWFTSWEEDADADEGLAEWAVLGGYDGAAIGLRADEAGYRKTHIRAFGQLFERKNGLHQCYPLAWWKNADIWAYTHSRGIAYNAAYDRLAEIGVQIHARRVGPLANENAMNYGQLAILKQGWPELFNQFAERYPEAKGYV